MPAYAMASARSVALDPTSAPVANPSDGPGVMMSPFSGPKGSPLDNDKQLAADGSTTASGNASTGALSTGIGYGINSKLPGHALLFSSTIPAQAGYFDDDETPGTLMPDGTTAADARCLAIGGGRNSITVVGGDYARGTSAPNPYAVQPLLAFGNGGSRDAGAGPAFTGFAMRMVTAAGSVANGSVVETGYVNRSGVTLATGLSQFGSYTAASAAIT